jgi:lipoprotein-anchoring transpeptidase ErfK/SrfK
MRLRILPLGLLTFSLTVGLGACRYEGATEEMDQSATAQPASDRDVSVPSREYRAYDRPTLDSQRLDPSWRSYAERDLQERMGQTAATPTQPSTEPPLTSDLQVQNLPPTVAGPEGQAPRGAAGKTESYEQISTATLHGPVTLPVPQEEGGPSALRVQVLLDRVHFSPGVIDGYWGKNTAKAVYWFQYAQGMPATGEVDQATWDALMQRTGGETPLRQLVLTPQDLQGPFVQVSDDVYEQAKLDCLCYESPLEMLTEHAHSTPELLQKLNPQVDFDHLAAGTTVMVPNVPDDLTGPKGEPEQAKTTPASKQGAATPEVSPAPGPASPAAEIAHILISKKGYYLQALDAQGKIVYHFPSTLGAGYDPSPDGKFQVTNIHFQPDFHYQPTLFHEVPDSEPEAHLPPGPNSPVGLVWMALSKPHYGIHGTAVPDTIGYTSSHGCVRLTNWDAVFLAQHLRAGVPVTFRD